MKPITSIFFVLFSITSLCSQTSEANEYRTKYKHSIGLNVTTLGYLQSEYNYQLSKRFKLFGNLGVSYEGGIVTRVGSTYSLIDFNFLIIEPGLALSYWNNSAINYPEPSSLYEYSPLWKIELPIRFNFLLSKKFAAHLDFSFLNQISGGSYNSGLHGSIRLGMLYRF
jgi:hypothetical protein